MGIISLNPNEKPNQGSTIFYPCGGQCGMSTWLDPGTQFGQTSSLDVAMKVFLDMIHI